MGETCLPPACLGLVYYLSYLTNLLSIKSKKKKKKVRKIICCKTFLFSKEIKISVKVKHLDFFFGGGAVNRKPLLVSGMYSLKTVPWQMFTVALIRRGRSRESCLLTQSKKLSVCRALQNPSGDL